jgi:tetratricopeptide (TPR) repeat protein
LKEKHEVTVATTTKELAVISDQEKFGPLYWKLASALDSLKRHEEAEKAILNALAKEPNNENYLVTHSHIVRQLGRPEESLKILSPLTLKLRTKVNASKSFGEAMILVLGDKSEIFLSEMRAYIALRQWRSALESLIYAQDVADANRFYPYRGLWYLTLKAKSGLSAKILEDSLLPSSKNVNHYSKLLAYLLGNGSLENISSEIAKIQDSADKQDARAESFFFLAAWEKLVNKNESNYQALISAINDLSPFGNAEWSSLSLVEID